MSYQNIDGIITIEDYEIKTHYMLFIALVKTKCGKVFQVLKTTQGFSNGEGFYISPDKPTNDGSDEVAVRKTKQDVINYLKNEGWKDYEKLIKNKKAMEQENYFAKPKKGELEKLFMDNCNTYFDRGKQGFPSEEVLKKQIEDHVLLGGDKTVWFAENKITHTWIKRTFNPCEIEITKDWEDTLIPNEAMVFISREECLNWINKHDLRLMYEPTDHLFSLGA